MRIKESINKTYDTTIHMFIPMQYCVNPFSVAYQKNLPKICTRKILKKSGVQKGNKRKRIPSTPITLAFQGETEFSLGFTGDFIEINMKGKDNEYKFFARKGCYRSFDCQDSNPPVLEQGRRQQLDSIYLESSNTIINKFRTKNSHQNDYFQIFANTGIYTIFFPEEATTNEKEYVWKLLQHLSWEVIDSQKFSKENADLWAIETKAPMILPINWTKQSFNLPFSIPLPASTKMTNLNIQKEDQKWFNTLSQNLSSTIVLDPSYRILTVPEGPQNSFLNTGLQIIITRASNVRNFKEFQQFFCASGRLEKTGILYNERHEKDFDVAFYSPQCNGNRSDILIYINNEVYGLEVQNQQGNYGFMNAILYGVEAVSK